LKILLIEDSRFIRVAIERLLSKAGHSVVGVENGLKGLREANANPPDLILLDMMLPGLDGPGVLQALKKNLSTGQIPVIVLTGLSKKNEAKLVGAGALAYIEKSSLDFEHSSSILLRWVETVADGLKVLNVDTAV
jgi:CheY-like chemotaxis protein